MKGKTTKCSRIVHARRSNRSLKVYDTDIKTAPRVGDIISYDGRANNPELVIKSESLVDQGLVYNVLALRRISEVLISRQLFAAFGNSLVRIPILMDNLTPIDRGYKSLDYKLRRAGL